MNRNMEFPLVEMTTPELWSRLGVQVFKIHCSQQILGCTSFVVQDGQAFPIGAGFGGHGVMDLAVCDLDLDGREELAYTYSWGSGIHRTQFAVWQPHALEGSRETVASSAFVHGDVRLRREPDGTVSLHVAPYEEPTGWGADQYHLGDLRWDPEAAAPLHVALSPRLDPTFRNQVWTKESLR